MNFECKFICAHSYDFTDGQGRRIVGCTAECFDAQKKNTIKVKVLHPQAIEGKKFGDDITVHVVLNGRYVNYEV